MALKNLFLVTYDIADDAKRDALADLLLDDGGAVVLGRSTYLVNAEVWTALNPEINQVATGIDEPDADGVLYSILQSLGERGDKSWARVEDGDAVWVTPLREPLAGDFKLHPDAVRQDRERVLSLLRGWGAIAR